MVSSGNKRIVKNMVMLYIRMIFFMLVSFYTSRVVLNILGIEDYGIYGVVGGVVSMFSFLNASMSGATSRFLTVEIGKGDLQRLKETFSSALLIHFGIAFVIFVLAETVGLWFLVNKLVIPENRMYAAHWIYQFSILSMIVGVTQVPYNANIIAHEKMDVYAYVEILNVSLKLLIVYLLIIGDFDKLILYAFLSLIVSVIIAFIYRFYCVKYFKESCFNWVYIPDVLKSLLSFSGWDLYVNLCLTGRNQGVNILLNIFFGPLVNAAVNIGGTFQGVLCGFGENVLMATRPRITKLYAQKDYIGMQKIIHISSVLGTICMGCVSIPMILESEYIITLWLKDCPLYSDIICNLCLIFSLVYFMFRPIVFAIHAIGKIKWMGIMDGTIYILVLPLSYLLFKFYNKMVEIPFILNILFLIIAYGIINLWILQLYIKEFNLLSFFYKVVFKLTFVLSMSFLISCLFKNQLNEGFVRLIVIILINMICIIVLSYLLVLDKVTKKNIVLYIKQYFKLKN